MIDRVRLPSLPFRIVYVSGMVWLDFVDRKLDRAALVSSRTLSGNVLANRYLFENIIGSSAGNVSVRRARFCRYLGLKLDIPPDSLDLANLFGPKTILKGEFMAFQER